MTSPSLLIDWLLLALSSFNTVLPLWLGLTILLNAERRNWGVWLAGLSMIATGVFFVLHSALLQGSLARLLPPFAIGWYAGWLAIIWLPLAWYLGMLWFAGFWEPGAQRSKALIAHRYWMPLVCTVGIAVLLLLAFADRPVYDIGGSRSHALSPLTATSQFPLLAVAYPLYILACYLLSLRALRNLAPSGRVMGDIARRRARPWLVATTLAQITISVLVGWALLWLATGRGEPMSILSVILTLDWFDLGISSLIAIALFLIGRAIVSYEIFTGKVLPRQGFLRHWRNAVILAIGYGGLLSLVLTLRVPSIFILLISAVVVALFYALLIWRSISERDRSLERLRPFIGSQQIYDRLIGSDGTSQQDTEIEEPFRALCADILGARVACLVPLGPLAPLAIGPLTFPHRSPHPMPWMGELAATIRSTDDLCVPLDPSRHDGAVWGIPLWSQRGLIGMLLIGEKLDGGLYTQEELEVARASAERLLDMQAGAEMARRLMALQRQRLAETRVLDAQTRRVLHDDVLPRLHAAVLAAGAGSGTDELIPQLTEIHSSISDLLRTMPAPAIGTIGPTGIIGALRGTINTELRGSFDRIEWETTPEGEAIAVGIPPLAAEVLFHAAREAARNAAKYGRGNRGNLPLLLQISLTCADGMVLTIEDNGIGIGDAPSSDGGSGQGMALHGTMMAVVGGSMSVQSIPNQYTRVTLTLPRPEPGIS